MNLFIIAAGNGSRLGAVGIPKALFPIAGIPNLINTIEKAQRKNIFERICVVISDKHESQFDAALNDYASQINVENVRLLTIESGKGSGHAVMEALAQAMDLGYSQTSSHAFEEKSNDVFCWGDTYFFNSDIFEEISAFGKIKSPLVIPVIMESQPYLSLEFDPGTKYIKRADFSKPQRGYHDQSIFIIDSVQLWRALTEVHSVIWDTNRYTTDVGEFSFMTVIQYLWNTRHKNVYGLNPAKAYITTHYTKGYNTLDEVRKIEEMLN